MCAVINLCGRMVLAYHIGSDMSASLVTQTIRDALMTGKVTDGLTLHSDPRFQYDSAATFELSKEYHFQPSMSSPDCPYDNAVMESFWGRFKDTLRKHFRYWECDDLRSTIEQAIYYFNNERPVRKLNGKPPVLFRTELVA